MASPGIKANVELEFFRWRLSGETQPLSLASSDGDQYTGHIIKGTVTLEKDEIYQLLRADHSEGKVGLFLLRIVNE